MHLIVNGQQREMPESCSVRELVVALGLRDRAVAVEVNQSLVPRKAHESTALSEGDRVEVVTLVGGG